MRPRRSTALLLSCVLGLFVLTAPHAGARPHHAVRGPAVLAHSGFETAHPSRTQDDATVVHGSRSVEAGVPAADPAHVPASVSATTPAPQVRGPPAVAHV